MKQETTYYRDCKEDELPDYFVHTIDHEFGIVVCDPPKTLDREKVMEIIEEYQKDMRHENKFIVSDAVDAIADALCPPTLPQQPEISEKMIEEIVDMYLQPLDITGLDHEDIEELEASHDQRVHNIAKAILKLIKEE